MTEKINKQYQEVFVFSLHIFFVHQLPRHGQCVQNCKIPWKAKFENDNNNKKGKMKDKLETNWEPPV